MRRRSDDGAALRFAWAVQHGATPDALNDVLRAAFGWGRREKVNAQRQAARAGLATFDHEVGVWRAERVARCSRCGKFSLVGKGRGHNLRRNGRPQSYCVTCAGEAVKRHRESLR